jgi:hypothetical protein
LESRPLCTRCTSSGLRKTWLEQTERSAGSVLLKQPHDLRLFPCLRVTVRLLIYRVIQEKRSIFWLRDSIGHCENKDLYEHMCNSDWLPRHNCLVLQIKRPVNINKGREITVNFI